jgi:hypothetical protein
MKQIKAKLNERKNRSQLQHPLTAEQFNNPKTAEKLI